jgi:hypothetical protein
VGGGYRYRPVQLEVPEPSLNVFEPDAEQGAGSLQGNAECACQPGDVTGQTDRGRDVVQAGAGEDDADGLR